MCDTLLNALDFNPKDKIIAIRENKLADASFILAAILSKSITDAKQICLITFHNTFTHYQNIGRRFGYDLSKQIQDHRLILIDPLSEIVQDFFQPPTCNKTPETIVKHLFRQISDKISEIGDNCVIIVDDLSHLLDLGCDLRLCVRFMQRLVDLTSNDNVTIVVNSHASVGGCVDDVLANLLAHSADLQINVSALKTGRSKNVSGVLIVKRDESSSTYHYKLMDKEIRVFAPGRAII